MASPIMGPEILQLTEMWRYKRSILNIYAVNELLLEREREHQIKY